VRLLRQRCEDAGVALRCRANVRDLRALPDCDLLVGADGANSLVRRTFAESFRPGERIGNNMFAWMGVRHRLEGYTLALRATGAGAFAAHLYPHSDTASTAVIECAESTWACAGLDAKSDYEACVFFSDVFAD
jgi:2-polyprenyl-6-methoxyphenol hydroxylase-like FAD-dependent oxidoreductase